MADIRVSEAKPGLLDEILRGIRRDHGATRERHTKVALNAVLTDAIMAGAITTNPARELASRRKRKGDMRTRGAPALNMDLRTFLKVVLESEECRAKDLADAVTILAATGLRRSELLALRWEDIDLDRCVMQVKGGVVRIKGKGLIRQDSTKGGDDRTIALPKFAVDCLRQRKELWRGPNTAGVIFPSSTGTLRDPDNMGKQWRDLRDSLGLPDVTSHSFRKTVATLIDDSGLSARVASDQLGHARTSMTQDVYMSRGKIHTEVASALDRVASINDE
ncbi:MAG: site-specific integrase [Mycobacteriaceae bacterium]